MAAATEVGMNDWAYKDLLYGGDWGVGGNGHVHLDGPDNCLQCSQIF